MTLHSTMLGQGPNVAFVHGFTQTHRSWLPVLDHLHRSISACLIDAPGHGESVNGQLSLANAAQGILDVMNPGILVGYSMGARMCLHAALTHNPKITGLVLISGTAGLDDNIERQNRRANDEELASHILTVGVTDFLTSWLAQPIFEHFHPTAADITDRQRNSPQGLADSLRHAGTGTQEPLWDLLHTIDIPVLLVAGELDAKFTALAHRMDRELPNSTIRIIGHAGHTVHLENTSDFVEVFDTWLKEMNQ